MRNVLFALLLVSTAWVLPAAAQRGDFLTDGEVEQIREAQDPNDRIKLYVEFARIRLDTISRAMATTEANRAAVIHDALSEYDQILDAIDKNVDQASQRRDLMRKGLEHALKQEPDYLKLLQGFRAANPKDLEEYRFVLDQAIDNTKDSIDGLAEVLKKQPKGRKEEAVARKQAEEDRSKPDPRIPPKPGATTPGKPTWDPNAGPPRKPKPPQPPQP